MDQEAPSQRSIASPPAIPTAHTSELDTAATPSKPLWRSGSFGLGTISQLAPVQCSMRFFESAMPTAHTSLGDTTVTARRLAENASAGLGAGTCCQRVPS